MSLITDRNDWRTERRRTRGAGWSGQPDRHDQLWGVIAVLLGMAGMAFLLIGQTGLYRVGMWVGGLR